MKRYSFIIPVIIASVSSLIYGIWNVLSYNIVTIAPNHILLSLLMMMAFGTIISFIYLFVPVSGNKRLKINKSMKYPVTGGFLFALGNILFFAMIRVQPLPIVAAIVYSNIIIFSVLLSRRLKTSLSFLYLLGTVVVVAGLAIIEVLSSGVTVTPDLKSILESILLVILYGFGSYFTYISSLNHDMAKNNIFMIFLTETAVIAVATIVSGGIQNFTFVPGTYILEILLTSIILIFAIFLEFKSFNIISMFKPKYINIINIFLNFETIWVLIFSIIFLSLSSPSIIAGVLVTSLGIWIISIS